MEWKGPVKPTFFDLPQDLREEMKVEAAKRRITLRTAVQEAFEAWLHVGKAPSKEHPDVEMLRRFLEIGSPEDIKFLHGNISVFLRDAERTRRRKGA